MRPFGGVWPTSLVRLVIRGVILLNQSHRRVSQRGGHPEPGADKKIISGLEASQAQVSSRFQSGPIQSCPLGIGWHRQDSMLAAERLGGCRYWG
jgi:hypothetical protein